MEGGKWINNIDSPSSEGNIAAYTCRWIFAKGSFRSPISKGIPLKISYFVTISEILHVNCIFFHEYGPAAYFIKMD
jgi:hypothetical protein